MVKRAKLRVEQILQKRAGGFCGKRIIGKSEFSDSLPHLLFKKFFCIRARFSAREHTTRRRCDIVLYSLGFAGFRRSIYLARRIFAEFVYYRRVRKFIRARQKHIAC